MAEIVNTEDLEQLLHYFSSYMCAGNRHQDEQLVKFQEKCIELFQKDYLTGFVDNLQSDFCPSYPMRVIIPEGEKPDGYVSSKVETSSVLQQKVNAEDTAPKLGGSPGNLPTTDAGVKSDLGDESSTSKKSDWPEGVVRVNNAETLIPLFSESRFARVHGRFAVPVMLFRGKNICRSATISRGIEVVWRTVGAKTSQLAGYFTGGVAGKAGPVSPTVNVDDLRDADVKLLKALKVKAIWNLMVEDRKKKYGMQLCSSESVDNKARYGIFDVLQVPYPGVEFFREFSSTRSADGIKFTWDHTTVNVELSVDVAHHNFPLITWKEYRNWDLLTLTKNYFKLLMMYVADDSAESGVLIHCISGWDRTPLFISLVRLSLWADGAIHKNLSALEIVYLTVAYDWMLFSHQLGDRATRGEDIFLFCFYFLQHILSNNFSVFDQPPKPGGRPEKAQDVADTLAAVANVAADAAALSAKATKSDSDSEADTPLIHATVASLDDLSPEERSLQVVPEVTTTADSPATSQPSSPERSTNMTTKPFEKLDLPPKSPNTRRSLLTSEIQTQVLSPILDSVALRVREATPPSPAKIPHDRVSTPPLQVPDGMLLKAEEPEDSTSPLRDSPVVLTTPNPLTAVSSLVLSTQPAYVSAPASLVSTSTASESDKPSSVPKEAHSQSSDEFAVVGIAVPAPIAVVPVPGHPSDENLSSSQECGSWQMLRTIPTHGLASGLFQPLNSLSQVTLSTIRGPQQSTALSLIESPLAPQSLSFENSLEHVNDSSNTPRRYDLSFNSATSEDVNESMDSPVHLDRFDGIDTILPPSSPALSVKSTAPVVGATSLLDAEPDSVRPQSAPPGNIDKKTSPVLPQMMMEKPSTSDATVDEPQVKVAEGVDLASVVSAVEKELTTPPTPPSYSINVTDAPDTERARRLLAAWKIFDVAYHHKVPAQTEILKMGWWKWMSSKLSS